MIRPELLAAMLLLPACDAGTATSPAPAELAAGAAASPQVAPGAALPAEIDPDPLPTAKTEIVSSETISVEGKPACLFAIRYPDETDQEVTWNSESCGVVNAAMVLPQQLREGGQLADLPQEARLDIERMTGGVFVVESQFSAAAYPLNLAGRIYGVPYAD